MIAVTGSQVSMQIRRRSVALVESTLPADVTLDAWKRIGAAPTHAQSTHERLAGVVLRAIRTPKVRAI